MDPYVSEVCDKVAKSLESFRMNLTKLRSGRANPAMLNGVQCDYYGEKMDISSLSSISMPEPRQLLIKPYSREDLKAIAAGIAGLMTSYYVGTSAGASITLYLAVWFLITFLFRKKG